ncbi:MAG TPA: biotin-dependent carboxyltransferase family protein [Pilimelia sp.]|nr:biotin-dependent carboxyltransferase family protein [Pilimelia sp.]
MNAWAVQRAGPRTTVQDAGRPGWAHLGVPRAGAADTGAWQAGNQLVGNPPAAASVEATLLGLRLRAGDDRWVAVTGAPCQVTVDGAPAAFGRPVRVPAAAVLDIHPTRHGVYTYLALAGGVATEPVLGSRSTDTLGGLGPPPLTPGADLPLGPPPCPPPPLAPAPDPPADPGPVPLLWGPRHQWLHHSARHTLAAATWSVSPHSDRVAVRLTGPPLRWRDPQPPPLRSEPMVRGAVQVPPDGQPLICGPDHPTTGGYPVVAVVHPAHLPRLAQARPGTTLTLHATDPAPLPEAGHRHGPRQPGTNS